MKILTTVQSVMLIVMSIVLYLSTERNRELRNDLIKSQLDLIEVKVELMDSMEEFNKLGNSYLDHLNTHLDKLEGI